MIVHRSAPVDCAAPDFVRSRSPLPDGVAAPFGTRLVTLSPGEVTKPHDHHDTEIWVVLDGEGVVHEQGRSEPLGRGDLVVLPPLRRHHLQNTSGTSSLTFLTMWWDDAAALGRSQGTVASEGPGASPVLVLPSFPTPNGDLHLGHLAGPYVAADACVRALRAAGGRARLLLGTIGHQSQVAVAAQAAGCSFVELAERNTERIMGTLRGAGVLEDVFVRPGSATAYERVARATFDRAVAEGSAVRERRPTWRCPSCERWLVEAFVSGRCPRCGSAETAGIECEVCALPYEESDLVDASCGACGTEASLEECERWWLPLEPLRPHLETYLGAARMSTRLRRYVDTVLSGPLPALPVSVPTDDGVDVGDAGVPGQRLYSAFELAGRFLTAVEAVARDEGYDTVEAYASACGPRTVALFGWDNAYLRAFAFPAVLIASGAPLTPPYALVCNEFYQLGDAKFSTGRGHAIWGRELADDPEAADPLRLHLAATRAEGRRTSFLLQEYRATLDEVESAWVDWLAGVDRRLRQRFAGSVPEAGPWDAEQFHFFASIRTLHQEAALAYDPSSLSLRRAAATLRTFVERAREFAVSQQPDGHPEGDGYRTGMALELMGARSFGLAARPLLPCMAGRLLEALDAAGATAREEPAFVVPGTVVSLAPVVAAWREGIAVSRTSADRIAGSGGDAGQHREPRAGVGTGAPVRGACAGGGRVPLPLWLVGFNSGIAEALGEILRSGSVDLLEEADVWTAKRLGGKVPRYGVMGAVTFAAYQQDRGFLDAARRLAARRRPEAVVPGLEYAVPATAEIAAALGLRGAGVEAARVLCDKVRLRECTQAAGMRAPRWREVAGAGDVADFAAEVGGSFVLKPAQRQASLGVLLLEPDSDLEAAWQECVTVDEPRQLAHRPLSWRYLVEERLRGQEFSTECLVDEGQVRFVNTTRKRVLDGRRPVELGHVVPGEDAGPGSRWWKAAEQLVAAVDFGTGVLHAEWIDTDAGPVLVECAGRVPGDRIVDLVDLAYGTNLVWLLVRLLAGRPVDVPTGPQRAAAIAFLTVEPGRVTAVDGVDEARRLPGVQRVDALKQPGDVVGTAASSWDRVASVLVVGASAEEAEARAAEALASIAVAVEP